MKIRKVFIIIVQIQTILSHREYHHNIKLRNLHKNSHKNGINYKNNRNDSELDSTATICGKLCVTSFILVLIFYLCVATYILRYFLEEEKRYEEK